MVYLTATAALIVVSVVPLGIGWRPHLVLSGSMQPAFDRGDVVLVAPPEPARYYEPGAVVTFRESGGTVTHRVVETRPAPGAASYVTKGDANRVRDSRPVDHGEVVGAVRVVVPLLGRPLVWLRRHQWLPLALWLATVAAALSVRGLDRRLVGSMPVRGREAAGVER
jgi:signal peptidase